MSVLLNIITLSFWLAVLFDHF